MLGILFWIEPGLSGENLIKSQEQWILVLVYLFPLLSQGNEMQFDDKTLPLPFD